MSAQAGKQRPRSQSPGRRPKAAMPREARAAYAEVQTGVKTLEQSIAEIQHGEDDGGGRRPRLRRAAHHRRSPVPTPGPGEALVKVVGSGVCHTDLHAAEGKVRAHIHEAPLEEVNRVLQDLKAGTIDGRIVLRLA